MNNAVPTSVGGYQLLEKLGEGGMSEVFRAYQPRLDRYVALKFIRGEISLDPGFRARFEQEARALAKLNHPNIVDIYDFGEDHHRYYLVMEFIQGQTLKERLIELSQSGQRMSLQETVIILQQVAAALDFAHQSGIIHRDIKPANILLTGDGRAVLNDFGVAKMMGGDSGLTSTGLVVGTPHYMSPEQVKGDPKTITPASDVYSLGVVLYEILTGRVPFVADTPMAVMLKHLHDAVPLPRSFRPDLPETLERVLLKALSRNPADRHQTAAEFAQAVQFCLLSPQPPATTLPIGTERHKIFRPGGKTIGMLLLGLLGMVTLFMAGFGFATLINPLLASQPVSQATTSLPVTSPSPGSPLTTKPGVDIITTPTELVTTPLPSLTPRITPAINEFSIVNSFRAPGENAQGFTWDGSFLWISENSGVIFQLNAEGKTLQVFDAPAYSPHGLAWDGSALWLFTSGNDRFYNLELNTTGFSVIGEFQSRQSIVGGSFHDDLEWDGQTLWHIHQYKALQFDVQGNKIAEHAFSQEMAGIAWDGEHLWIAWNDWPQKSKIVKMKPDWNEVQVFTVKIDEIRALAWVNGALWALGKPISTNELYLYQMSSEK